uniref:Uncharacterized protein n=1 Tax=Nicotiana tabacum TaxID=4097 RepID=A0A1S3ZV10_TOBAC|nr:PREDICTED: uncharacterized protein LOC107790803 [Nicotiana tabacum]
MSCRAKCNNTSTSKVALSNHERGRWAAPVEHQPIEKIATKENDYVPCMFVIWLVNPYVRYWFQLNKDMIEPTPEQGIDEKKLERKYPTLHDNIQHMWMQNLFQIMGPLNISIVKEFYTNWEPGFELDGEYVIPIWGPR